MLFHFVVMTYTVFQVQQSKSKSRVLIFQSWHHWSHLLTVGVFFKVTYDLREFVQSCSKSIKLYKLCFYLSVDCRMQLIVGNRHCKNSFCIMCLIILVVGDELVDLCESLKSFLFEICILQRNVILRSSLNFWDFFFEFSHQCHHIVNSHKGFMSILSISIQQIVLYFVQITIGFSSSFVRSHHERKSNPKQNKDKQKKYNRDK